MLIDHIVDYCHMEYTSSKCHHCNHIDGCPGNGLCKTCLEEVHYLGRYANGRKDYNCNRIINFYVCDYAFKYTSEMLYLLRKSEALKQINGYHIMSIGCGACPDLMAFERYCFENGKENSIQYYGIDVNERWKPIHDVISAYSRDNNYIRKTKFEYADAVTDFSNRKVKQANVIVLQYLISHFYNTNQIDAVETFFDVLVQNVVVHKQENVPFVILINDVNSNNRGRDYFEGLLDRLKKANLHGQANGFYFPYRIFNDHMKYGTSHETCEILYEIPNKLDMYTPWTKCSSAQLLIEIY